MDSLCEDLKRDIISLLPINYLIQINKNFESLYDNNYYNRYLNINYPDMIFKDDINFLEMCKKSRKEGDIYEWKWSGYAGIPYEAINMNIYGIKASTISKTDHLILRFNGDLYIYNGKTSILIDTDVTDIDSYSYIKHNKWYYVEVEFLGGKRVPNCRLLVESDEDFINMDTFNENRLGASTSHSLYILTYHFPKGEIILQKTFDSSISKFLFSRNFNINVLLETREIISLDDDLNESSDRNFNIDYLFNGLIKMDNGYYIYDNCVILQEFIDEYGEYINSTKYGNYILTDKYLLEIKQNNNIICRRSNIKNICGGGQMVTYEIR